MIIWYSRECSSCAGNQALSKMKAYCEKRGVEFQEHRTILWEKYEEEADSLMEAYNVKMPFFYATSAGEVLVGNTLTPLEDIEKLVKKEIENAN